MVPNSTATGKPTTWWPYALVMVLALTVRAATAAQLAGPENLDAEYYLLIAQNLVQGKGLVLDAVWHFWDDPQGFPHPAGSIWLPLPSFIQAAALAWGGGYRAAQVPQVLMSGGLVVLALRIGWEAAHRWSDAWLAALLLLFGGGTVMARQVDTDCYATYALFGSLALYAMYRGADSPRWLASAGLFIGLASITRNDGPLLLVVLVLYLAVLAHRRVPFSRRSAIAALGLYLLVAIPWWIRNVLVFGQASPVPALYPALLREYGEFFSYQLQPSWQHFMSLGWSHQLRAKSTAALGNLGRLAWVFQVWEVPFIIVGAWAVRRQARYWPPLAFPVLLHLCLSLVYTFPSERGTFLHSISAFLPFGAAFCALGLRRTATRIGQHLRARSRAVIGFLIPCLAVIVAFAWGQAIARSEIESNQRWHRQRSAIATWVEAHTAPREPLMCNVGLGVTWLTGRPSVTIPFGGLDEVLAVAGAFNVQYLIVSELRPQALSLHLPSDYGASPRLEFVEQWEGTLVYRFLPAKS